MNPYFVAHGVASNAPNPTDTEVVSLQKINALLYTIANKPSAQTGHFDANGNIQVYDPVNDAWLSLTAPNGVLQVN